MLLTDGPTDIASYNDARTHLKRVYKFTSYLLKGKQGRIHDIRCVPILHNDIFSGFYKSVTDRRTDRRTDRPTDGRTDTPSYRDARTHLNKAVYTT